MEDTDGLKIEFGKLIEILIRQWLLILGSVFVFALVAVLLVVTSQKMYRASALVASIKSVSQVSLGSAIETLSEEQLSASMVDRKARLQSYVELVKNPAVAELVLIDIQDQFPDEKLTVTRLLDMVSGSIAAGSDSILVSVTSHSPQLSAAIANAWAHHYVNQVNTIYSEKGTDDSFTAIQEQIEKSQVEYAAAQEALQVFLATNNSSELERRIKEQQSVINGLSSARSSAMVQTVTDLQTRLSSAYENRRLVDAYLANVVDMHAQVETGGEGAAASNVLALTLLKARVYAIEQDGSGSSSSSQSLIVQTSPVTITASEMLQDLDGLINSLQEREVILDKEIQTLSVQLLNASSEVVGIDNQGKALRSASEQGMSLLDLDLAQTASEQKIQTLEGEVNTLQAQLEGRKTKQTELEQVRDLTWETLKTVTLKQVELDIASRIKNAALAVAAPASVPENDIASGLQSMILAAIAGGVLGLMAAFGIEFWWAYQGVTPYSIVRFRLFSRKKS